MNESRDIEALHQQIEELEARLKEEQLENATLRRILFSQYAKHPRVMRPLDLPISDRAIVLFEILPQRFDLETVLATAEQFGMTEAEAAEHVRTYFQEGMLEDDEDGKHFVKTGHRPYYQVRSSAG